MTHSALAKANYILWVLIDCGAFKALSMVGRRSEWDCSWKVF